jgi:hypothetical protein
MKTLSNEPTQKDRQNFLSQKSMATKKNGRDVEWKLSFEQWWDWWQATGHFHERGCRKGQYVMSRIGDIGPYEINNIFCQLHSENLKEAQKGRAKEPVICPHCSTKGGKAAMIRWHFNNCKFN